MYQRDARETVGCLIALILLSLAAYIVAIVAIAKAVARLLA